MTVKNATKCSQMVLTGNSSNNTDSTLTELISLWPSSVTDGIKQIQEGSNFLLIFYSLSLAISVPDLTVKSAWLWISISSHHHLSKFNQSKPTESPLRHRDSLLKWQQFLTLVSAPLHRFYVLTCSSFCLSHSLLSQPQLRICPNLQVQS